MSQNLLGPKLIRRFLIVWTAIATGVAGSCGPPTAIEAHKVIDFNICYQNLTTIIEKVTENSTELARWSTSGCFHGDPRKGILTRSGCKLLCGTGYRIWAAEDSFGRIAMWIVPALILLGRLAFPLLDLSNCAAVVCHVIGDPIDALYSLSLRYEALRWMRRQACLIPGTQQRGEDVTEISIAYEQFGWQTNTPKHFETSCSEKLPTAKEWTIIQYAARQLRNFRQKSVRFAIIAIVTLIVSLISAISQTISRIEQTKTRVNTEIGHTIAVVCLLFYPIPLVWFSSEIGTYTSITEPIHIINSLRRQLEEQRPRQQPLFPELPFIPSLAPGNEPIMINEINWPKHASYYGVHGYWRPFKSLPSDSSLQKGPRGMSIGSLSP
jgi:hypothetical protein